MKKEVTANGIKYDNYGTNNYSCGMEPVIFNPADISPEQVHMMTDFYLHPSEKPNSLEIFALKGKPDQYKEFTKSVKDTVSVKQACNEFKIWDFTGEPNEELNARIEQLRVNFSLWYYELIGPFKLSEIERAKNEAYPSELHMVKGTIAALEAFVNATKVSSYQDHSMGESNTIFVFDNGTRYCKDEDRLWMEVTW